MMDKKLIFNKWVLPVVVVIIGISACKDDVEDPGPPPPPSPNSSITFKFSHNIDGVKYYRDSIMYTNLSDNKYSISSLRYLISDIRLDDYDGKFTEINQYHLVDINVPSTHTFRVSDSIKKNDYKSISYYIGFLEDENIANGEYDDLDELNWAFPPNIDGITAGGYYSIQLTGEYLDVDSLVAPYEIKIGGNKLSDNSTFEPNQIIGSVGVRELELDKSSVEVEFRFNISRLFSGPNGNNRLDLDDYNIDFESNTLATEIVSSNARTVFSLGEIIYGSK